MQVLSEAPALEDELGEVIERPEGVKANDVGVQASVPNEREDVPPLLIEIRVRRYSQTMSTPFYLVRRAAPAPLYRRYFGLIANRSQLKMAADTAHHLGLVEDAQHYVLACTIQVHRESREVAVHHIVARRQYFAVLARADHLARGGATLGVVGDD